jgi:flavin-dependent dehydrogenase
MREFDTVIIGAGLAGLQCARLLSQRGASVLMVDRKDDLAKCIHTTGIFVRRTFEDFHFPAGTLGPAVRNVTLYSPRSKSVDLESDVDEFRVGKMGAIYEYFLRECIDAGVEFQNGTRYVSARCDRGWTIVNLEKAGQMFQVAAKVLVGADGAVSRVARDLGLDQNLEWIVGYEEVFHRKSKCQPRLHCFVDPKLAPGYLAWVADDGEEVHVGVGGYAADFDPRGALSDLKKKVANFLEIDETPEETRGGRIPVGGILRRIANENGLLIGDAAGAVSPLTAGGLDPCLRLSAFAADVIAKRISSGDPSELTQYSGDLFRARFTSRLWMRRIISVLRNPAIIEVGFGFLRTAIGVRFARHVFFGRGSFPDIGVSGIHLRKPIGEQIRSEMGQ